MEDLSIFEKGLIVFAILFVVALISILAYFGIFYKQEPYDTGYGVEDNIPIEVNTKKETKDVKKEEVRREPTVKEIIREIEKEKPRFNLTIQPNLVAEYKDYTELKESDIQTAMVKLTPDEKIYPKTIGLTEEDIKRLQKYEANARIEFKDYDKKEAKAWIKFVNPISFPYYKGAKVEWFSDSNLVYKTIIGQTGVRGILRLQFYEDNNIFNAVANKVYEIDTEIVVSYTDNYDNTTSMKLNKISYLSNIREVE